MKNDSKELYEIYDKIFSVQRLDSEGHISLVPMNKVCVSEVTVKKLPSGKEKKMYKQVSKDYLYLEWIDDDTYIFGELSCDPLKLAYPEQYDDIDADIKYGVLKLQRNKENVVIPYGEKIIVQSIYDKISQNNDKTVTVNCKDNYAYFDYEKGVQLTPVVLKHAVPFSTDYEGFAECSTKDEFGYLPRDTEPVHREKNIKLLTEEQVKVLTKYQKEIDNIYTCDEAYKEITLITFNSTSFL